MQSISKQQRFWVISLMILLAGCASHHKAPVVDKTKSPGHSHSVLSSLPVHGRLEVRKQPNSVRTAPNLASSPRQSSKLVGDFVWVWPAEGTVIHPFNVAGTFKNNGIDIAGQEGSNIVAAAPGKVVYSGNGLRGYGRLIILKHNAKYLTAYGQNRTLFVKEGDTVKAGQKIAEMGRSSAGYAMLHFEIRQGGKPVDPKRYLAAK